MFTPTGHQGGFLESAAARPRAPLPTYRNDTGARRQEAPAGVSTPNVRDALPANEICQRNWVREIIGRNGSAEDMLAAAIQRVVDQHNEERLLEAQAIINELGRSGEHSALLQKHLGAEQIRGILGKDK